MSMGVYIKGMDMPECCAACEFSYWSNLHQTGACDLVKEEQTFEDFSAEYRVRRSQLCPLIEIPPHGDLIDRDALLKEAEVPAMLSPLGRNARFEVYTHAVAIGDVMNAPTIIPASEEGET